MIIMMIIIFKNYELLEYERTNVQYVVIYKDTQILCKGQDNFQGKLAHRVNDFTLPRKELLELHWRIDIGSSFKMDAPMKDSENFP